MSATLKNCSHVLVRDDALRIPLSPIYQGPYKVLDRYDHCYLLQPDSREDTVHVDRLKPAFLVTDIGNESTVDADADAPPDVTFNIETSDVFDYPINDSDQTAANAIFSPIPDVTFNSETDSTNPQYDFDERPVAKSSYLCSDLAHKPNRKSARPINETDMDVTTTPAQNTDRRGRRIRRPARFINIVRRNQHPTRLGKEVDAVQSSRRYHQRLH